MALGGENSVHAKPLFEALKVARAKSRSERLTSCQNFLERVWERVARIEDLIAKATMPKATLVVEVQEVEERLKQLEAEAAQPTPPSEAVVTELQRRIEDIACQCSHPFHRCHPADAQFQSSRFARCHVVPRIESSSGSWRRFRLVGG